MIFPKITIAIPTFNEEENIIICLESIFSQNYPREFLEVIVVDDYSTDDTIKKIKKYPVKILYNGAHDAEIGKMIAFRESKGNLFYYLDADAELKGKDWLMKMIKPLQDDEEIVGVFTRELSNENSSSIEKYFSLDPLLRDPLHEFFSPSIDSTVIKKTRNYNLCNFLINRIPPAGRCLYRKKVLDRIISIEKEDRFMEMDILWLLVNKGYSRFAYVPNAGIYHHHIVNLFDLIRKRKRNIQNVYLDNIEKRKYKWIDTAKFTDILKIIILLFYANTIIFSTLRGIYKAIRNKSVSGLWEPIVSLVSVDATIFFIILHGKSLKLLFSKK